MNAILAAAVGPRPVLDRPDEGSAAAAVLAEFQALNADVREALKGAGVKTGELETKMGGLQGELFSLQQRLAMRGTGSGVPLREKSFGEQFTEADGLKEFAADFSRPRRFRLDVKSTITTGDTSGGSLSPPFRDPTVTMLPYRRATIRDLLPTIQVTGNSVEFPKQSVRTTAAAPVAEGAAKPESAYAWELETTPIRVIAHWVPASRQVLDDSPQLKGLIDQELIAGLGMVEEAQLLNGDGTGQNLLGLIPQATAFSAPITITSPTRIDTLGLAILQSALADFPADGVVINPADWAHIRLLKNGEDEYIMGPPGADVAPRLFGLPVVATQAMTVDKFLVGNFRAAGTIYDRWSPRIEISTEHADYFVKNLVAILAEERIGLAVKQSAALVYGDFGAVA